MRTGSAISCPSHELSPSGEATTLRPSRLTGIASFAQRLAVEMGTPKNSAICCQPTSGLDSFFVLGGLGIQSSSMPKNEFRASMNFVLLPGYPDFHRAEQYTPVVRVIVNFQHRRGWNIHTMAEDCRTPLGPFRDVASEATLMRLFKYLGATPESLDEAAGDLRRWSRGGIHIDVPEDRLHLLGVTGRSALPSLSRR